MSNNLIYEDDNWIYFYKGEHLELKHQGCNSNYISYVGIPLNCYRCKKKVPKQIIETVKIELKFNKLKNA